MASALHLAPEHKGPLSVVDRAVAAVFHVFVCVLPLAFYAESSFRIFEFTKLRMLYVAASLAGAGWGLAVVFRRRLDWYRTPLDWPLAAYVAVLATTTALSTNVARSVWGRPQTPGSALGPTLACIVLFFVYVSVMRSRARLERNAAWLAAGGVLSAVFSTLQHYGLDWINADPLGRLRDRAIGTIGNADPEGWYIALLFPILTWMFMRAGRRERILLGTAWCVIVLGLLSTWSRSAFLGALLGGLGFVRLLVAIRARRGGQALTPLITLTVLALATSAGYLAEGRASARLAGRVSVEGVQAGGLERVALWQDTLEIWMRHPLFGSGPETFGEQQSLVRESGMHRNPLTTFNHAHNQYLQMLATSGVAGLAAYLWLIWAYVITVIRFGRTVLAGPRRVSPLIAPVWPLVFAASYGSILISQHFNPDFLPTTVLFFLLPAMTVAWKGVQEEQPARSVEVIIRPWLKWMAVATLGALVAYSAWVNARSWQAYLAYNRAVEALRNGRAADARTAIDRAVALNASDADFWWVRAEAYAVTAGSLRNAAADNTLVRAAERVAVASSARSVEIDASREDLWRQRAFCLRDLAALNPAHVQEAIGAMREAIARFPNSGLNYLHLARLYRQALDVDHAIQSLETAIRVAPEMALPHAELAVLRYQSGQPAAAGAEVDRYLAMSPGPNQWDALTQLRLETEKAGDAARKQAVEDVMRALSRPAQNPGRQ